jgi:hypothetical protein
MTKLSKLFSPARRHRLYGVMYWLLLLGVWLRPQWWHGDPRTAGLFCLFLLGCAQFSIAYLEDKR